MDYYILSINGIEERIDSYEDAISSFRHEISKFLDLDYTKLPNKQFPLRLDIGGYFELKKDTFGELTKEEINILETFEKLTDCFYIKNKDEAEEKALSLIKESIDHSSKIEEYDESIEIKINKNKDEIYLFAKWLDEGTYPESNLETNAFIFSDHKKTLYFKSSQCLSMTADIKYLGKLIETEIILECVND